MQPAAQLPRPVDAAARRAAVMPACPAPVPAAKPWDWQVVYVAVVTAVAMILFACAGAALVYPNLQRTLVSRSQGAHAAMTAMTERPVLPSAEPPNTTASTAPRSHSDLQLPLPNQAIGLGKDPVAATSVGPTTQPQLPASQLSRQQPLQGLQAQPHEVGDHQPNAQWHHASSLYPYLHAAWLQPQQPQVCTAAEVSNIMGHQQQPGIFTAHTSGVAPPSDQKTITFAPASACAAVTVSVDKDSQEATTGEQLPSAAAAAETSIAVTSDRGSPQQHDQPGQHTNPITSSTAKLPACGKLGGSSSGNGGPTPSATSPTSSAASATNGVADLEEQQQQQQPQEVSEEASQQAFGGANNTGQHQPDQADQLPREVHNQSDGHGCSIQDQQQPGPPVPATGQHTNSVGDTARSSKAQPSEETAGAGAVCTATKPGVHAAAAAAEPASSSSDLPTDGEHHSNNASATSAAATQGQAGGSSSGAMPPPPEATSGTSSGGGTLILYVCLGCAAVLGCGWLVVYQLDRQHKRVTRKEMRAVEQHQWAAAGYRAVDL